MIIWPKTLSPQVITADPIPRNLSSTVSTEGTSQTVSSGAPIWYVVYGNIPVVTEDQINTWRAISALVEGSLTPIVLPLYRFQQPNYEIELSQTTFDDNATFSDGSLFEGNTVDCFLSTEIFSGTITANFNYVYGKKLLPGQTFSIDNRAYRVKKIISETETTQQIKFTPPARQNHLNGSRVEIDDPKIQVVLENDKAMLLELQLGRWGFPSLSFVEYR